MKKETSIRHAMQAAMMELQDVSDSPKQDIEILLCEVLNCTKTKLIVADDSIMSKAECTQFFDCVRQRKIGRPISYIIGHQDFWSLSLDVNESTLIPRPETEILIEQVLELALKGKRDCLDLGTGTGAIALAIAKEYPLWQITGCDIVPQATELAIQNQKKNNINNAIFLESCWFDSLEPQSFDIIVSNPPYVESNSKYLEQGDLRFEPISALISGLDGLDDIRHIVRQSGNFLKQDGWLLLEHGFEQGEVICELFEQVGFSNVHTIKDYAGLDRVTLGQN